MRSVQTVQIRQALTSCSMMLINSLLSHVNDTEWDEFISELERLNVRKAVIVRGIQFVCRGPLIEFLATHVVT